MTTSQTRSADADAARPEQDARISRTWAVAGVGAGVTGVVSIVGSSMSGAVYDEANYGDPQKIVDALGDMVPQLLLFHTATMLSCALLVVFAAGLHRQLSRRTGPDSLVPASPPGDSAWSPSPS